MTTRRIDWPLLVRTGAVLMVAVLAYTSCGTLMPGAGTAASSSGAGPGVTDDSVKVVFIGTDLTATASMTGFKNADVGKPDEQVKALEAYVNANGGIAGRKLEAVYREYEASKDSPATETALCSQITQDDKAFAVVLTGQLQSNARPCYAQRRTLMLDATLIADDRATFTQLDPYLWTATYPEYDRFATSFLAVLIREKFFEGRTEAGLVAADTPANKSIFDKLVVPSLQKIGVTVTVSWIDTTSLGTLNNGLSQAAVNLRGRKIDRVFFLGGARIAPFFMTSAKAQSFTATYGVSTFDSPVFMVNNPGTVPPESLKGMIGIGFAPAGDVPDSRLEFPATDAERRCLDIFSESGIAFERRENARVALTYCDAALLLQQASKDLGPNLNAAAWGAAARSLEFATAGGFGGTIGADGYAAGTGYRVLKYDTGCSCFTYQGEVTPLASEANDDVVLRVDGLSGGYGAIQVLFGIDLTVRRGETVALCGPNGVGKSTLVRMISGLNRPSAGTVVLNGRDVTGVPGPKRPRLGLTTVIGQQAFGSLSVRDNLRMHCYPVPGRDEKPDTAVDGALAVFPRLRARADQPASTLSGGERQMLVLAKTLIQRPSALLIDEFSLGLAPVVVGGLLELIRRLAAVGVATLLIEQSVNVAMSVADRLLFMEHGTIIAEHTPAELRASPDLARRLVLGGHAQ